jgi:hypothetical protein
MAKIKLHNPELAANSKFSNLVVESLNTDPTISGTVNVGRIWFNNTDKTFKASFLDEAGTGLTIKTIGDSDALTVIENNLTQEIADRTSADATLQSNIDTTNANLAQEVTDRTAADSTLQGNIDTTNANLATETTNRTNADAAIQAELDNTQTGAGLGVDGSYTANATSNYLTLATDLNDADQTLDTALKTEETARISADSALDSRVTTVESQVNGKIGDLTTLTTDEQGTIVGALNEVDAHADTNAANLATEVTNRTNADNTLQSNIDSEASARITADDDIQAELDATQTGAGLAPNGAYSSGGAMNYLGAATSLVNADYLLDTALKTEETARIAADDALDSRVTTVESQVNGKIGDLTTLTTDEKGTIVGALNEVDANANAIASDLATNYLNKTTTDAQVVASSETTFQNDLVIQGNLTVTGATTTVEAEQLTIADNIITLNSGVTGAPTENAGLEVDRGDAGIQTILQWDEANDYVSIAEWNGVDAFVQRKVATKNYVDTELASASSDLQAELDATQTGAGLAPNGAYSSGGAMNYLGAATSLVNADYLLDTALKAEETARIAADNTLTTNLNNEITARTNADNTLQSNIDAEETARIAADDALDSRVTTVESQVNGKIGDLTTLTTDEKGTIVGSINEVDAHIDAEVVARTNADSAIQADLVLTQTGAGLANNGAYPPIVSANYISGAVSLRDADNKLDTALKTEETARITADNALDARVTTVESQVNGKIGDLTTLTTDEKGTIVGALNEVDANTDTNTANLAQEVTDRTNADSAIQAELDATQVGAGLGTDGGYTADATSNYITTATDLYNADQLLDAEVKTVDDRLTTVEGQVNGKIGDLTTLTTDEKGTIVGAVNEVDANIDAEVARATAAEATLTSNLNTEISDRTSADNALGVRIDNVNTAAGISGDVYTANGSANFINTAVSLVDADNKLDTEIKRYEDQIASTTATTDGTNLIGFEGYIESDTNIVNPTIEIAAGTLKAAIDDIASSVNTRINEFENRFVKGEVASTDKSDTYTIAHNLDTEFVDVSVQVYDEDETVWRFDLVVVEVIDVNTVKISLASGTAAQIRYVIQGY